MHTNDPHKKQRKKLPSLTRLIYIHIPVEVTAFTPTMTVVFHGLLLLTDI